METLLALLPIMLAAAIVPGWTVLMLLLLQNRTSVSTALAFLVGIIASRLVQGGLASWVSNTLASHGNQEAIRGISVMLEIILGIAMLGTGVKSAIKAPESDDLPPRWMERIDSVSPLFTFGAGIFLVMIGTRQWIFSLAAIRVIQMHESDLVASASFYLLFTFGASLPLIIPFAMRLTGKDRSRRQLESANRWLIMHGNQIVALVSLSLGVWFLIQGISGMTNL